MSREDEPDLKKLAASVIEALNRHDSDALLALSHPDYELQSRLAAVESGSYRGPQGFQSYFRDLDEGFADAQWELREVIEATPGHEVVLVLRFAARGRESGVPVDLLTAMVWTFRDGEIWRSTTYPSKAEALEAAGLSE